jgi:hypothetical protein
VNGRYFTFLEMASDGILVISDESTGTKDSMNLSQHNTVLYCTEYTFWRIYSASVQDSGNMDIIYGDSTRPVGT